MTPAMKVVQLRCEYLQQPLGLDETQPRLSWTMDSERRGARQMAWRVGVATSAARLAAGQFDLWDSGRVPGERSTHIVYEGVPLQSRMRCVWNVTIWDELGQETTSPAACWTMGLLSPDDWQAQWITAHPAVFANDPAAVSATPLQGGTVPLFRKSISLAHSPSRGTLYVSARGLIDARINGTPVSPDRLVPEWTDYHRRLHYRTYDVTQLLTRGENVLGMQLGDGWWSGFVGWQEARGRYGSLVNSLLCQLEVEMPGEPPMTIASDPSWHCHLGPILSSDLMMGECHDARREQTGWDRPGFDASGWSPAREVVGPTRRIPSYGCSRNEGRDTNDPLPLVAQRSEPIRVVDLLQPISVAEVDPGVFIYDFGQNFTGWVRLRFSGHSGQRLQIRHGERLDRDGRLYTDNLRRARATDVYIARGDAEEMWEPRFTIHGFQYVELTGRDEPLPLNSITGCVVMSSTMPTGVFTCSHPLVNRLWQNIVWSQKGNFVSVPLDCPQRDERLGWTGDAQVFARTATYNMDVAAFFSKWMVDVTDSQDVDGIFPDVAPRLQEGDDFVGLDGLGGAAGWADAGIIIPWTLWQVYGDTRIVERHWESMVRWLDWLERTNPEGIRCHALGNNYGDWLCIPSDTSFRTESPLKTLLATAFWADDAAKMARMAEALGREADARRFAAMFDRVREAFQRAWLLPAGRLAVDTQTAYLLALAFDLIPEEDRAQAVDRLVDNIRELDWHLSTGFIGIRYLNPILTLAGRVDVAERLLCNEDYPSWLYPVRFGATTIWERWNGWTDQEGFFNPQMNSFNHYSLGSVGEWLFRHVAGIELDPQHPGFQHFRIRPYTGGLLQHAAASYQSIHGVISCRWQRDANQYCLAVRVPPNTSATVTLPGRSVEDVFEGERPVLTAEGVTFVRADGDTVCYRVLAGSYQFTSTLPVADSSSTTF